MLYICATPIGNLNDISIRAIETLSRSDVILCEDTRTSRHLLDKHQIPYKKLIALHDHNENEIAAKVVIWLSEGLTITQISDAGTPGISDPGARLCSYVRQHGFKISPIPGACAYISLLSVSGLTMPSLFYGFLPAKKTARTKILNTWQMVDHAVCIYEAPHRIIECIEDIINSLGAKRNLIMGRELTKQFETIKKATASELLKFILSDTNQQKGEFVILIAPNEIIIDNNSLTIEQINTLNLLLKELPPKKAVNLSHKLTGGNKDLLYNYTLVNK
jgi:16S rRNA (cytidine1402-2'-O)-methyltransferase